MNCRKHKITTLTVFLILFFPFISFALPQAGETVTQRGTVDDDYYAAGGTVDINAIISGDAVIAGGDVFISHKITGDVLAAGGSIYLRGEILDDVRTAGGEITIDANIGDDLIASGGTINLSAGSNIGGDAWLAGGDVYVAGTVNKDLLIGAGSIRLSGIVHGDVILEGGNIEILDGAIIDGELHYRSPSEASIDPAAKIMGKIIYQQVEWEQPHGGAGIFFVLTMIVASIVLFKLFPGFTLAAADRISADPLKSLGVGFLVLIIVPVVSVLLISIILGVWIGLSMMAFYFVSLVLGFIVACFCAGDWVARRFNIDISTSVRRLFSVALVIVVLGLFRLVPVIGGVMMFVLLLSGLGAVILQLKDFYSRADEAR